MIQRIIALYCLVLFAAGTGLIAQKANQTDPEIWASIEERWNQSQPVIIAYTKAGKVVAGQQIHTDSDSLYIFKGKGLPAGPDWKEDLVGVHVNNIDSILFQPGGNIMTRKDKADSYQFPEPDARYSEPHLLLRKSSVYVDSLVTPSGLDEAFGYSKVLRQAFQQKHVRVSIGANFGGDVIADDIEEMISGTGLSYSQSSYGQYANVEVLDASVRLFNRLIIGGSLFSRKLYTNVYGYSSNSVRDLIYDYSIDYTEHRLYVEYAILNTDRYFSRKYEVIAGAGLLFGKPEWYFDYSYYIHEDPYNSTGEYNQYHYSDNLLGFQVKTTFHYYFFPGLSLWTGLDVNLYQPFVIPEQSLSAPGGGEPVIMPEHHLGFNCMRFKLGLSIYF